MNHRAGSPGHRAWMPPTIWLCLLLLLLVAAPRLGRAQIAATDSVNFFTNLSARLLQAELGLDLNSIQVYPTNQYTPAAHRLLQVVANLWDARTNRQDAFGPLPTVFAPRFTVSNNAVFITGYVEVQTTNDLSPLPPLDLTALASTNLVNLVSNDSLIFGVPLVIGVRKGLPNFNEVAMEAVFSLSRKVQLVKSSPGGQDKIVSTNQYFILSCDLALGEEFWNSYASNYTRPVEILVNNRISMFLTNDLGITISKTVIATGGSLVSETASNSWEGWREHYPSNSLKVPLRTNMTFLPVMSYLPSTGLFYWPSNAVFDTDPRLLFPQWFLSVTNRVQAMILDATNHQILDYVLLGNVTAQVDWGAVISQDPSATLFDGLWATNRLAGGNLTSGRYGVIQQMEISKGNFGSTSASEWNDYGYFLGNRPAEIARFLAFFTPNHIATYFDSATGRPYTGTNTNLTANLPFTPMVKLALPMSWQANDPLVHFMSEDLLYSDLVGQIRRIKPPGGTNVVTLENIGTTNKRYKPWPYDPGAILDDPNAFKFTLKDPLVRSSSEWPFPTNECTTIGQLSQIHRGTPWQTLYLKGSDLGYPIPAVSPSDWIGAHRAAAYEWASWTGNPSWADGFYTRPARDWAVVAHLAMLLNTNSPPRLLSLNNPDPNAWLAVLDGLSVLTNISSDSQLMAGHSPQFDSLTVSSNSTQAGDLVASIFNTRSNQGGGFRSLGDLLASPALSTASPWLNQGSSVQLKRGLTDEAYECLPAQLLSRLRPDSVGELSVTATGCQLQFTGWDAWTYVVETSSNLVNWIPVSTNHPVNGVFGLAPVPNPLRAFYRSRLLP